MENFHRAKHWHLFLAIFVLPFVLYMGFMAFFAASMTQSNEPMAAFGMFKYFFYIILIPVAIQYGWMYSVGVGLQDYLPSDLRLKTGVFKAAIIGLIVYTLITLFLMNNMMSNLMEMDMQSMQGGEAVDPDAFFMKMMTPFFVLAPLGLFAVAAQFYAFYFVAKTYKTTERQQPTSFGDFVGEFFMVWFLFVGIWIMQPKINQMTGDNPESRIDDLGRDPFEQ